MNKQTQSSQSTIFLTGATGLVASYLLKILLEKGHRVYALARGRKDQTAQQRVEGFLTFWDEHFLEKPCVKNLIVVEGDITDPHLQIQSRSMIEQVMTEAEIVYHSAALAELRVPLEEIRKINVAGTRNVFEFALHCKKVRRVNHISTAYVVGTKQGITFTEDMLKLGQGFHNTYEQSKYEAELLVEEYRKRDVPISVLRPSMVMGDSQAGKTTNFRLIYEPLHFFAKEIYDTFPANPDCFQNLIHIDTAAEAMYLLGDRNEDAVYHIVSPQEVTVRFFMETAAKYFGFSIPECIPAERFDFNTWTPTQRLLAEPFVPYFNYTTRFGSVKTAKLLKDSGYRIPEIKEGDLKVVYGYCQKEGYLRSKR